MGRVRRNLGFALLCVVTLCAASPRPAYCDGSPPAPSPIASPSSTGLALLTERPPTIAANPGASNPLPGTGLLGKLIGLTPESGIRIGGLWVGNSDYLFTGGQKPRTWSFNSLLILNLHLNLDKIVGLSGATVDCSMLQFKRGGRQSQSRRRAGLRWTGCKFAAGSHRALPAFVETEAF